MQEDEDRGQRPNAPQPGAHGPHWLPSPLPDTSVGICRPSVCSISALPRRLQPMPCSGPPSGTHSTVRICKIHYGHLRAPAPTVLLYHPAPQTCLPWYPIRKPNSTCTGPSPQGIRDPSSPQITTFSTQLVSKVGLLHLLIMTPTFGSGHHDHPHLRCHSGL